MINEMIRKNINVDKSNILPIFTFKEGDNAILKLALFKNSTEFDITGQTVRLGAKTKSGLIEQIDGFTISKNNLDIKLKNSILVAGKIEIDLEIKDTNGVMTTASFFIVVNQKVLNDEAVEATNEFDTFTKAIDKVETAVKTVTSHTDNTIIHITSAERSNWDSKSNLELGETETTAYRGDLGKKAYTHSQTTHAPSNAQKNVQSDWNVTDNMSDAYIKNKPYIPKAYDDSEIRSLLDNLENEVNELKEGNIDIDLTNYVTKSELSSKADKTTLTAHTSDTTSHITATERNTWNAKSNLTLGTTSTTAFRGDYGNTAYTHSQSTHAPSNAQKNSDITKSEIEAKLRGDITTHSHSIYALASDVKTKDNFVINISSIFAPSPQLSANGLAIIVNSLDEMTDVSKKYVFNGYVYECVVTEIVKSYTNVLKTAKDVDGTIYNGKGYKDNTRLNSSGEVKDASGTDIDTSGKITCKVGDRLRIKSVKSSMNYTTYIYSYNDSNVKQGVYTIASASATTTTKDIDMTLDSATFGANFTNIRFCSGDINDNTIVTINEPIENSTETTYEWVNTGEKYEYGDFDAETCTAQDIYDYLEVLCSKYPNYITKETLGKDESGTFDCNRYVLSKHFYQAWQKVNYPKMYAFVNGSTTIYATSVSPRIGDTLYTTKYIGTSYAKVTAVNTASQTRTINSKSFTRDESKDVEPTLVYTSILADSVSPNGIVYNENQSGISMISTISKTSMSDNKGVSYKRYPLGDKNRNMEKPIVVTIGANEHGPQGDPKEPAIICARFIKDLCECKNSDNELLNHLKNNIMLVIMPIINPYGFTNGDDTSTNRYGYYNYNQVNINRNYDCKGFGQETNAGDCGEYGGSENETQYFMNTLAEPKSVVGISIHCLGYTTGGNDGLCHYQGNGFNADKMNEIAENMKANYNLKFTSYGEAPQETTAKSPTYISKIGAKGGIIEFQAREGYMADSTSALHTSRIMEANYTLLLECIYAFLTD